MDKEVHLYKDACIKAVTYPYLKHAVQKSIRDIHFVPFEDVMGIGHSSGFSSILVPGKDKKTVLIGHKIKCGCYICTGNQKVGVLKGLF